MELTKKLESNIWKFYAHKILTSCVFAVPIIVLFWQENGLSLTEIMVLQSLYSISIVTLELPSGYFADIFGRKLSIVLSVIFAIVGAMSYTLGFNFYHFLIAEIFLATGCSLLSGADSAFLYDTLKDLKKEDKYKEIFGKAIFYSSIALAICNILGGFIGSYNYRWTFYPEIILLLIALPISISMYEPIHHKVIIKQGHFKNLLKTLKETFTQNIKLRSLIIFAAVIYAFRQSALWFYQPYFELSGLDVIYFGFIFASFQIISAFSAKYAHKIEEILGQKFSLILLVIILPLSYLLMSNFIVFFSFTFAFAQQFTRGFSKVVISDYVNKLTNTDTRATILSLESLMGKMLYATIIPIAGWVADVYSLAQALSVLGITTFAIGSISLFLLHKNKVI